MKPEFRIFVEDHITAQQFMGYISRFSQLYQARWIDAYSVRCSPGASFFTLHADAKSFDGLSTELRYYVELYKADPQQRGFGTYIEHWPLASQDPEAEEEEEEGNVLLDERWSPPEETVDSEGFSDSEQGDIATDDGNSTVAATTDDLNLPNAGNCIMNPKEADYHLIESYK